MTESTPQWFRGVTVTSSADERFIARTRELASSWERLGLSADRSESLKLAVPFLGVELPHLTTERRWLWIAFCDFEQGMSVECRWGDLSYYDDYPPSPSDLSTEARADVSAEDLALEVSAWVIAQASRAVRREDWDGFRASSRWCFEDTGQVLAFSRYRWGKRSADRVSIEKAPV